MHPESSQDFAIPPALAVQVKAVAEAQHRQPLGVLSDALEQYLESWRSMTLRATMHRSPIEAAARMRRSRSGNVLPDNIIIHDLMTNGRA